VDNRFEYLTEKQLEYESAILIDLDLKFEGILMKRELQEMLRN
jgi:hypothetical protein